MATIDKNKDVKPLVRIDWTRSSVDEPFFQETEAKKVLNLDTTLPNRYSIRVDTEFTDTGGEDLAARMESAKYIGVSKILEFYNKKPGEADIGIAEDWYLPERPGSKLRVLVSISEDNVDKREALPIPTISELPAPWEEIQFSTFNLDKKIKNISELLNKYKKELDDLRGKAIGIDITLEYNNLLNFTPSLTSLMSSNGYVYDSSNSNLLTMGVDKDYNVLYTMLNDGNGYNNLYNKFNLFKKAPAIKNDRTIYFLSKLDELNKLSKTDDYPSLSSFFDEYVLNPPVIDFSKPPPQSYVPDEEVDRIHQEWLKARFPGPKTQKELEEQNKKLESQKMKAELQKLLDSKSEFVNDYLIGSIGSLSDGMAWVDGKIDYVFDNLLNKFPIQNLITSALECLGFRGTEFWAISKQFLNNAEMFLKDSNRLFDLPLQNFPDDFPIVNYMKDIGIKILNGMLEAIVQTLIKMVMMVLEALLDFCSGCVGPGGSNFAFGKLNLGDLTAKLGAEFAMGVVGAVDNGLQQSGVKQLSAEVVEQTNQWAKNPVLLPGEKNAVSLITKEAGESEELNKEDLQQQASQMKVISAKKEMSKFLDAASAVLTPGEAGNLLLGCNVGNEPVSAIRNLLDNFPAIKAVMTPNDIKDSDIKSWFKTFGDLVSAPAILSTIADVNDSLPEQFRCLCDEDESNLRADLLNNRATRSQIEEQLEKSKDRREKELKDLADLLNKGNFMDNVLPSIYCSKNPDGTIKPGLIENDHPSMSFMMDSVLDTVYDNIALSYNQDVAGLIPTMMVTSLGEEEVQRTNRVNVPNIGWTRVLNPRFVELVNQGVYSYGSVSHDAINPGFSGNENKVFPDGRTVDKRGQRGWAQEEGGWFGFGGGTPDDAELQYPHNAGQWDAGQTRPTGEQEYQWEIAQLADATINNTQAGRYSLDFRNNGSRFPTNGEMTAKFGYSPIPIKASKNLGKEFIPGLKDSFENFCSGNNLEIFDREQFHIYGFNIPNKILEQTGMSVDQIKKLSDNQVQGAGSVAGLSNQQMGDAFTAISKVASAIQKSKFEIDYIVPFESSLNTAGKQLDSFALSVVLSPLEDGQSSPYMFPLSFQRSDKTIDEKANYVISLKGLDIATEAGPHIPQEKYFVKLLKDSWNNGGSVWNNNERVTNKPIYGSGIDKVPQPSSLQSDPIKDEYYDSDAYDQIFKELYCSFTNQISKSPYLDGANINKLNFHPMRQIGSPNCNPHLLDLEAIKDRIKKEYTVIQCIEASYPSVDGLGSNKDNPFEQANFSGAVLTAIRTYTMEVLLRSVFSFYWFRYQTAADVDQLLVSYIANIITGDISARSNPPNTDGNYIIIFKEQVLKLYNRNRPPAEKLSNYKKALEYLVRQQIFSCTQRLSNVVGSVGETSIDTILLEEWLPTYNVPNVDGKSLNNYGEWANRFEQQPESFSNASGKQFVEPQEALSLAPYGELSDEKLVNGRLGFGLARTPEIQVRGPGTGFFHFYPVGSFFREFYSDPVNRSTQQETPNGSLIGPGLPKNIWSYEESTTSEPAPNLTWIRGDANYLSRSKENTDREKFILWNSALLQLNQNKDPTIKQNPVYKFGVSDSEKQGMEIINNFMFASTEWMPQRMQEIADVRDISEADRRNAAAKPGYQPEDIHYYPGSWLRVHSKQVGRTETVGVELKGNDIWREVFPVGKNGSSIQDVQTRNVEESEEVGSVQRRTYSGVVSPPVGDGDNFSEFGEDYVVANRIASQGASITVQTPVRWVEIGGVRTGPWVFDPYFKDWINEGGPLQTQDTLTNTFLGTKNSSGAYSGGVLTPTRGRQSQNHLAYFQRTINLLNLGKIPYMSLLDFDLKDGLLILQWELEHWKSVQRDDNTSPEWLQELINKYENIWIPKWNEAHDLLQSAASERMLMRSSVEERLRNYPVARREMATPLTFDMSNGNIIQEIYLRIEELDASPDQKVFVNYDDLVMNHQFVDDRDDSLRGVVNIDAFQDYITNKFKNVPDLNTLKKIIQGFDPLNVEECGEDLKKLKFIPLEDEHQELELRDFFSKISVGVRISYISPLEDFQEVSQQPAQGTAVANNPLGGALETAQSGVGDRFSSVRTRNPNWRNVAHKEKAYFVKETSDDNTLERRVNTVPIISFEYPINMEANLDINPGNVLHISEETRKRPIRNIQNRPTGVMEEYVYGLGFFRKQYENHVNRYDKNLLKGLQATPEYKLLFKYLFPLDRMLAITNVYSHTYISGLREIDGVFDTTKENIKQLFFILDGSGNPYCPTYPSNMDLMDALMNGLDVPGMAGQIAMMIAKTSLLIFKGFMETADPNIAMTRKVIDIIHLTNRAIAQGLSLANQAQEIGTSIGDLFSTCEGSAEDAKERIVDEANQMIGWAREIRETSQREPEWTKDKIILEVGINSKKVNGTFKLLNLIDQNPSWTGEKIIEEAQKQNPNTINLTKIAEQQCDLEGCSSTNTRPPGVPPDAWFDPIDQNFIPEPQAWMISLALFPGLLFPPLNGIPMTPFGFVYWALDYKPDPNWLHGPASEDFLHKLFSKEADDATRDLLGAPPASCAVDLGLPPPGVPGLSEGEE